MDGQYNSARLKLDIWLWFSTLLPNILPKFGVELTPPQSLLGVYLQQKETPIFIRIFPKQLVVMNCIENNLNYLDTELVVNKPLVILLLCIEKRFSCQCKIIWNLVFL